MICEFSCFVCHAELLLTQVRIFGSPVLNYLIKCNFDHYRNNLHNIPCDDRYVSLTSQHIPKIIKGTVTNHGKSNEKNRELR